MESNLNRAVLQRIATSLVVMAIVLLLTNQTSASSTITTSNSSGSQYCSGSMQECLIIDDANLSFFADPEASLVVSLKPGQVLDRTKDRGRRVIDNCGRGKPYRGCVPRRNKPKIPQPCIYIQNLNRNCK